MESNRRKQTLSSVQGNCELVWGTFLTNLFPQPCQALTVKGFWDIGDGAKSGTQVYTVLRQIQD